MTGRSIWFSWWWWV